MGFGPGPGSMRNEDSERCRHRSVSQSIKKRRSSRDKSRWANSSRPTRRLPEECSARSIEPDLISVTVYIRKMRDSEIAANATIAVLWFCIEDILRKAVQSNVMSWSRSHRGQCLRHQTRQRPPYFLTTFRRFVDAIIQGEQEASVTIGDSSMMAVAGCRLHSATFDCQATFRDGIGLPNLLA